MGLKSAIKKAIMAIAATVAFMNPSTKIDDSLKRIECQTAKAEHNLEGRLAVLGFDIVFNCLKSGIGNKVNGNGSFWEGCGKGALAGAVVYGGKEIASHNYMPFLGATGKLVHDLGVSMSDNATFGRSLLQRYVTDFGPIELSIDKKEGVSAYFHPYSAYAIAKNIARGNKFDFKETLYNLTPVFSFNVPAFVQQNSEYIGGMTNQNVFSYCKNCRIDNDYMRFKSHEMAHVLNISEFRFIDEAMGKKSDYVKGMPIVWKLEKIIDYIKVGPFIGERLLALTMLIGENGYWYNPLEIEAYTFQRPAGNNSHPFYK